MKQTEVKGHGQLAFRMFPYSPLAGYRSVLYLKLVMNISLLLQSMQSTRVLIKGGCAKSNNKNPNGTKKSSRTLIPLKITSIQAAKNLVSSSHQTTSFKQGTMILLRRCFSKLHHILKLSHWQWSHMSSYRQYDICRAMLLSNHHIRKSYRTFLLELQEVTQAKS